MDIRALKTVKGKDYMLLNGISCAGCVGNTENLCRSLGDKCFPIHMSGWVEDRTKENKNG